MVWEVKEMALLTKKISEMLGAAPGVKASVAMVSSEVWKVDILTRAVQCSNELPKMGLHIIFSICTFQ